MENVTVKIELRRINGVEVKYTVMDMFERDDTGQSRARSKEVGRESKPRPCGEF